MTDELEPTTTIRRRTTPRAGCRHRRRTPGDPAAPPTAPLTPASRPPRTADSSTRSPGHPGRPAARSCRRRRRVVAVGPLGGRLASSRWSSGVGGRRRLFTGRSSTVDRPRVCPGRDSIMYGEVRLDLPGDQRAAVGAFLSKFPGFADQAALDTKLDEILDRLVGDATNGSRPSADIKPWFDGELAFSVGAAARPQRRRRAARSVRSARPGSSPWCRSRTRRSRRPGSTRLIAESGAKTDDRDLQRRDPDRLRSRPRARPPRLAIVDGKVAVAGDIASVKAAIDTNGASALRRRARSQGRARLVDRRPRRLRLHRAPPAARLVEQLSKATDSALGGVGRGRRQRRDAQASSPTGRRTGSAFEDDALVMEATAPEPETASGPTENRTSTVAEHVPATAVARRPATTWARSLKETLDSTARIRPQADRRPDRPGPRPPRRPRCGVRLGRRHRRSSSTRRRHAAKAA